MKVLHVRWNLFFALLLTGILSLSGADPSPAMNTPGRTPVVPSAPPDVKTPVPEAKPVKRVPKYTDYIVLPLGEVSYETVEQFCSSWLTEDGVMKYEKVRRAVLISDTPEVIERIRKFIREVNGQDYNVRITVQYLESGAKSDQGVTVYTNWNKDRTPPPRPQPRPKPGPIVVIPTVPQSKPQPQKRPLPPPRPQPNQVVLRDRNTSTINNETMILMAGNGLPATLWSGKTMVDPTWLAMQVFVPDVYILTGGGGVVELPGSAFTDPKWVDVGSRLEIRPFYNEANDTIRLELYPSISFLDGKTKRTQAVRVKALTTTITVKNKQRVYIGGLINDNREGFLNLFGPDFFKSKGKGSVCDIYVTCEALKVGDPANSNVDFFPKPQRKR